MSDHVTALCRSGYYELRQVRPVPRALPEAAAKTFISYRLDYCNALLYGITDNLFRRLQSIQNAAARLLTGTRRRDHISPVLSRLHWLSNWLYWSSSRCGWNPFVPRGWLRAHRWLWTPSSALGRHQRSHCSANLHSARRQEFFGGGTDSMEQSSRHTAKTWHRSCAVQTTFKGISVWRDCGPLSTFCL